jgi:hypothetical protein
MTPARRCTYRRLDNGVHEFVMHESSRAAVDEFIAAIAQMAQSLPPGRSSPSLIDTRVGLQPLHYSFTRMMKLVQQYPAPDNASRVAMIVQPHVLLQSVATFMRLFPWTRTRFFTPDHYAEALAWLVAGPSDR